MALNIKILFPLDHPEVSLGKSPPLLDDLKRDDSNLENLFKREKSKRYKLEKAQEDCPRAKSLQQLLIQKVNIF